MGRYWVGVAPRPSISSATIFPWSPSCRTFSASRFMRLPLILAALAVSGSCLGQSYPARPVRLVIAAAPGGSTDVLGRVFAQRLSERMGQPFVPENRGGGGGVVASEFVAKSSPDGY